jgi:hypothetical protein
VVAARIAGALAADDRAAMAAYVEEYANGARAVAAEDDRAPAHCPRHEVARRLHLALVPRVDPADVEDAAHLVLEHHGIDHRRAMHAEIEAVRVVQDEMALGHGRHHRRSRRNAATLPTAQGLSAAVSK